VAAVLDELADDNAMFFADTGTPCIWAARHIHYGAERRLFGSFTWASMASASPNAFGAQLAFPGRQTIALCGDGGFTMLAMGDLLTEVQRRTPVVHIIFDNGMLDFVNIEQQEAGFVPFGTDFVNPDFSKVAEACGARGIRIEEPGDVRQGLQAALAHNQSGARRVLSRQNSLPSGSARTCHPPPLSGRCQPGEHRAGEGVRARRPDRGRWR
jgi:pyruvate dehydrogenase (quinone)